MVQEKVMEIQCEECRTVFSVDGGLIKEGGTKVRCSICGHIFTVFPQAHAPAVSGVESAEPGGEEAEDGLVPLFDGDHEPGPGKVDESMDQDTDTLDTLAFQDRAGRADTRLREVPQGTEAFEKGLVGEDDPLFEPESDLLVADEEVDGIEAGERAAEEALPELRRLLSRFEEEG